MRLRGRSHLTPALRTFLLALEDLVRTGRAPTFAEFARQLGYRDRATVGQYVAELEARGWIVRTGSRLDQIEIVKRVASMIDAFPLPWRIAEHDARVFIVAANDLTVTEILPGQIIGPPAREDRMAIAEKIVSAVAS